MNIRNSCGEYKSDLSDKFSQEVHALMITAMHGSDDNFIAILNDADQNVINTALTTEINSWNLLHIVARRINEAGFRALIKRASTKILDKSIVMEIDKNKSAHEIMPFIKEGRTGYSLYFHGTTPLDFAVAHQTRESAQLLVNKVSKEALKEALDSNSGQSNALEFSLMYKNPELLLVLLDTASDNRIRTFSQSNLEMYIKSNADSTYAKDSAVKYGTISGLVGRAKEDTLNNIKKNHDQNEKIKQLEQALDPTTRLGKLFHIQRGNTKPSINSGYLKKIHDELTKMTGESYTPEQNINTTMNKSSPSVLSRFVSLFGTQNTPHNQSHDVNPDTSSALSTFDQL